MAFARLIGLIILTLVTFGIGSGTNAIAAVATAIFFPSALALYFLPTIEANINRQPNSMSIFLVNLFLGWTLIGWVLSLAWAHKQAMIPVVMSPKSPSTQLSMDIIDKTERTCPFCAEVVKAAALKCKHCGSELTAT